MTARMYLTVEASYTGFGLFQSLRWSRLKATEARERIVRVERLGLILHKCGIKLQWWLRRGSYDADVADAMDVMTEEA